MSTPRILLFDLSAVWWWQWAGGAGKPVNNAHDYSLGQVRRLSSKHTDGGVGVGICVDRGQSFRKVIDPAYKSKRPEKDPVGIAQLERLEGTLADEGFPIFGVDTFEGDDIIASAVAWARGRDPECEILIAANDKDLFPLIEPGVRIYQLTKSETWGPDEVLAKLKVSPPQVRDLLALAGDKADDIPGVMDVGFGHAARLLGQFGSVDELLRQIDAKDAKGKYLVGPNSMRNAILVYKADLLRSLQLVTLRRDVPCKFELLLEPRRPRPAMGASYALPEAADVEPDDDFDPGEYEDDGAPMEPLPPGPGLARAPLLERGDAWEPPVQEDRAVRVGATSKALAAALESKAALLEGNPLPPAAAPLGEECPKCGALALVRDTYGAACKVCTYRLSRLAAGQSGPNACFACGRPNCGSDGPCPGPAKPAQTVPGPAQTVPARAEPDQVWRDAEAAAARLHGRAGLDPQDEESRRRIAAREAELAPARAEMAARELAKADAATVPCSWCKGPITHAENAVREYPGRPHPGVGGDGVASRAWHPACHAKAAEDAASRLLSSKRSEVVEAESAARRADSGMAAPKCPVCGGSLVPCGEDDPARVTAGLRCPVNHSGGAPLTSGQGSNTTAAVTTPAPDPRPSGVAAPPTGAAEGPRIGPVDWPPSGGVDAARARGERVDFAGEGVVDGVEVPRRVAETARRVGAVEAEARAKADAGRAASLASKSPPPDPDATTRAQPWPSCPSCGSYGDAHAPGCMGSVAQPTPREALPDVPREALPRINGTAPAPPKKKVDPAELAAAYVEEKDGAALARLDPSDPAWRVALEPRSAGQAMRIAHVLFNARIFSQGTPEGVFAILLFARERGLGAFTALTNVHMIEGKPSMSAGLIGGLVLASGKAEYFEVVSATHKEATLVTKRRGGSGRESVWTFSMEDAAQAGLLRPSKSGKPTQWERNPRAMLIARVTTLAARAVYSDVVSNLYTPEELGDEREDRVLDATPAEVRA